MRLTGLEVVPHHVGPSDMRATTTSHHHEHVKPRKRSLQRKGRFFQLPSSASYPRTATLGTATNSAGLRDS